MNFLAHIFLSYQDEDLMIGNFIADLISNKDVAKYSQNIQNGIYLHRQIDSYTDSHPIVKRGTQRLQPRHRKYSPVILDVLFDYLLANNWEKYSSYHLPSFTQSIYSVFNRRIDLIPDRIIHRLPEMIENDFLLKYGMEEGLRFTFNKMKKRVSYPQYLDYAVESLNEHYEAFNEEFNLFFPDVIHFVNEQIELMDERSNISNDTDKFFEGEPLESGDQSI